MRIRGFEPPPNCSDTDLNRARLPVPPYPHDYSIIHNGEINSRCFLKIISYCFHRPGQDISRVLYLTIIYLDIPLPACSSDLPSGRQRAAARQKPYAHFGLAPDGVYTRGMLPCSSVSSYLTISPLPRHDPFRRCVSVALSLWLPTPDVIRHPRPVEPGLSSHTPKACATVCLTQSSVLKY